ERTRTGTRPFQATASEEPLVPVLTVVHHADLAHVGERLPFPLDAPVVLGRGSDLFGDDTFDDSRLSRRHVELRKRGDDLDLVDLESRNGTWLNGQRVTRARVSAGDLLVLGKIALLLHSGPFRLPRRRAGGELRGVGHLHAALLGAIASAARGDTTVLIQ